MEHETSPFGRIWTSAEARELHEQHPHLVLWRGLRRSAGPDCQDIRSSKRDNWDSRPEAWTLREVGTHPRDNAFSSWAQIQGPIDGGGPWSRRS